MALYSIRSGVTNHPEDTLLQQLTDAINTGGIIRPDDGGYLVEEPSGGGLNVDVAAGRGYVKKSSSNAYPIRSTATETIKINANNSGNPRITTIVAIVDLSASPESDGQGVGVHEIVAVDGTPAASPQPPSDSAIASAIGAANPFTRLANVTVAHEAAGISNANIEDVRRRPFFRSMNPLLSVDFETPYEHDYLETNQFEMILTGNFQLNAPTNMEVGDWLIARFVQDGTGGRTLTFDTGLNAKSADVEIASGANETTTYALQKVADGEFDVFLVGKDY